MNKKAIVGILLAVAFFVTPVAPAHASSLTTSQIQAILNVLRAFNVPSATITTVENILYAGSNGYPGVQPSTATPTGVPMATIDSSSLSAGNKVLLQGAATNTNEIRIAVVSSTYTGPTDWQSISSSSGTLQAYSMSVNIFSGRWVVDFGTFKSGQYRVLLYNVADLRLLTSGVLTVSSSGIAAPTVDFVDTVMGEGKFAMKGSSVAVLYTLNIANGPVVDSNQSQTSPLRFIVGDGSVIQGLADGVVGLREGGQRRITIPPSFGYGSQDTKDASGIVRIPANSTLVMYVTLLSVQ